jgi:hypothetical protein
MLSTVPLPAVYAENSDSGVSVMQSRMAKILDRIFGAEAMSPRQQACRKIAAAPVRCRRTSAISFIEASARRSRLAMV